MKNVAQPASQGRTDSCEDAPATSCSSLRPKEAETNFPKFGKLSRCGVIGCHCPSQGVHGCYLTVSTLGPSTEANQGSGHDCGSHPGQRGGAGARGSACPPPRHNDVLGGLPGSGLSPWQGSPRTRLPGRRKASAWSSNPAAASASRHSTDLLLSRVWPVGRGPQGTVGPLLQLEGQSCFPGAAWLHLI